MTYRKTKAQSVTEYAILLGVAIAVFAGMQLYVKRGLNAKIKQTTDTMTSVGAGTKVDFGLGDGTFGNITMATGKGQYEPYYTDSSSDTFSESSGSDAMDATGTRTQSSTSVSGQAAGSYRGEGTASATAITTHDNKWN